MKDVQGPPDIADRARRVLRLTENAHLLRYFHPSSLRRTSMYASFLGICPRFAWTPHPVGGSPVSEALHLDIFRQPLESRFLGTVIITLRDQPVYAAVIPSKLVPAKAASNNLDRC